MKKEHKKLFIPIGPKTRRAGPFWTVLTRIQERLELGGHLSTDEVWKICRLDYNYFSIAASFRELMAQLIVEGHAKRVANGQYEIKGGFEIDLSGYSENVKAIERKFMDEPDKLYQPPPNQLTKYSAQDPGVKRIAPFYSKVYGKMLNE